MISDDTTDPGRTVVVPDNRAAVVAELQAAGTAVTEGWRTAVELTVASYDAGLGTLDEARMVAATRRQMAALAGRVADGAGPGGEA